MSSEVQQFLEHKLERKLIEFASHYVEGSDMLRLGGVTEATVRRIKDSKGITVDAICSFNGGMVKTGRFAVELSYILFSDYSTYIIFEEGISKRTPIVELYVQKGKLKSAVAKVMKTLDTIIQDKPTSNLSKGRGGTPPQAHLIEGYEYCLANLDVFQYFSLHSTFVTLALVDFEINEDEVRMLTISEGTYWSEDYEDEFGKPLNKVLKTPSKQSSDNPYLDHLIFVKDLIDKNTDLVVKP